MYKAIKYIGSKQKLLEFLNDNVLCKLKENDKFFDGFVGTGIVSQFVAENYENIEISGSDISLYSGKLFSIINKNLEFKENELEDILKEFFNTPIKNFNNSNNIIFNEFSNKGKPLSINESRNFFDSNTAFFIDSFRTFIFNKLEQNIITNEQSNILLFILLAYTSKNANTTSIYSAYLKGEADHKPLTLDFCLNILKKVNDFKISKKSNFINKDILSSLKEINKQNIIYLDPPYTTRRYENNYHILNYIVDKDFDYTQMKNNSKGGVVSQMEYNPFGKKKDTFDIFEKMILLGVEKSELLAISYNSDGLIKQEWIEQLCLDNNLKLETITLDYKRFTSSNIKSNESNLVEILWLITQN